MSQSPGVDKAELEELAPSLDDAIADLRIDPDASPLFVAVVGRKGSGKSEFLRTYAKSWPYSAAIVDPTKDLDPDHSFTRPWPGGTTWPAPIEDDPIPHRRYRITPNRLQEGHREEVDAIVLACHQYPEPTLVLVDEARYLLASDEKLLRGTDVLLNEGRHGPTFVFVANPRAIGMRPLFMHQADWIVVFDLPDRADVERVAGHGDIPADELEDYLRNLEVIEGPKGEQVTGFVLIDKRTKTITVYPPLPLR